MVSLICCTCESAGAPVRSAKGHFAMEIFLWVTCGLLAVFILTPLIMIPMTYSVWRLCSRRNVCGMCGNETLIPTQSPAGQRMLAAQRPLPMPRVVPRVVETKK